MSATRHRNLAALQAGTLAICLMTPASTGSMPFWLSYVGLMVGAASAAMLVMNLCLWREALGREAAATAGPSTPAPGASDAGHVATSVTTTSAAR